MSGGAVLVYDDDCGFCRVVLERLRRSSLVLPPVTAGSRAARAGLGLRPEELERAAWLLAPEGRFEGAEAFTVLLCRQPRWGWRFAGRLLGLPGVRTLWRAVYRLTARNRHRLPGGTAACALPPRA
ncbi:MAG: DCC1-like thiol-disulfide oxidoreductase family protein [Pseudoclavibacter sp.]|nr:DCC1-like thiol-disulfide oxidoreductase family protein [Pseudoclavibacter sp.]